MFTKREAAELVMRTQDMTSEMNNHIVDELLKFTLEEFIVEFKKNTNLTLLPVNNSLFAIKY